MNQQFVLDIVSSCLKDFRSWIFKTEINFGDIFENKAQSDHKKILITMKLAVDYILKINNYPKPTSVKTKCKKKSHDHNLLCLQTLVHTVSFSPDVFSFQ